MVILSEPVQGSYFVSTYPPFSTWSEAEADAYRRALESPFVGDTELGLYAHIPFCDVRCRYCYYLSKANPDASAVELYLDALLRELSCRAQASALRGRKLSFVYFGGGTPSMLAPEDIHRLMDGLDNSYERTADAEMTFECAPRTANLERLQVLRDRGVTRISMGVQQLNDAILQKNGRVHTVQDVESAIDALKTVDFDVLNLDLIVGLIDETETTFFESLDKLIAMGPESVTLYQLELPLNTPLSRAVSRGAEEMSIPSWETKRRRLATAFERLEGAGYAIRSAYSAVKDPSEHRFVYQDAQYRGADLVGVGASAFSYVGGVHHQNIASTEGYRERIESGQQPWYRARVLSDKERMVREFILQLKLGACEIAGFRDRFGVEVTEIFAEPLAAFSAEGWIETNTDAVTVTRTGLLRIDRLIPYFYPDEHRALRYS